MSVRDLMRQEMNDRLDADFPIEYGTAVPVQRENHRFETPKNTPYIGCWFRYSNSGRATIGTTRRFVRHTGFFMIDVVVPDDTGSATLWKIVDALSAVFKEQNFNLTDNSDVTLQTPKTTGNPRSQDGYYYITVMVPFRIDAVPE